VQTVFFSFPLYIGGYTELHFNPLEVTEMPIDNLTINASAVTPAQRGQVAVALVASPDAFDCQEDGFDGPLLEHTDNIGLNITFSPPWSPAKTTALDAVVDALE
jgi:hypothetical protein